MKDRPRDEDVSAPIVDFVVDGGSIGAKEMLDVDLVLLGAPSSERQ